MLLYVLTICLYVLWNAFILFLFFRLSMFFVLFSRQCVPTFRASGGVSKDEICCCTSLSREHSTRTFDIVVGEHTVLIVIVRVCLILASDSIVRIYVYMLAENIVHVRVADMFDIGIR